MNPPSSWIPSKVKYLANYINGYPFKPSEWSDRGKPIIRIQNLTNPDADPNYFEGDLPDAYLVTKGDLLLSWSASLGAYEWKDTDAWLNQHIFKVVLDSCHVTKPYYKWLAEWFMEELNEQAHGSTMQHVTKDRFGGFKVFLPPPEVQEVIVAYLNRETIHIDALISEKERMLVLLEEMRSALIIHAVTRGLDTDIQLKPSGVDWLGDIPEHWDMKRAKGLFREIDRRSVTGEEELLSLRMNVGLVPHKDVSDKILEPSDLIGFKHVEPGQMVINRMRAASGLIAVSERPGLVSPDYAVFEIIDYGVNIDYFLALFTTSLVQAVFRSSSKGLGTGVSGFLRLYTENFHALYFPYPSLEEQKNIVDYLHNENIKTSELESVLRESIGLLKERRSALIAAAVTGQIDPKDMAA